tara:strand:+ start:83 stop:490 length:408 start_codon:yes stop_codon:yes gene_type:complete
MKSEIILKGKLENIIEKIEQGNTLTKICKDKAYPGLTTVYKAMREDDKIHQAIMKAREVGTYSILDQIHDELNTPQDPKYFQQYREKAVHARWLASKLASGIFGDKQKIDQKTDSKLTISWARPQEQKAPGVIEG